MIAELQTAISQVPPKKARLEGLTNVEAVKIKVERAALLFRGAPIVIGVSALNAGITAVAAWNIIDRQVLLAWTGATLALALIRAGVWLRYRAEGPSARNMARFARVHVLFMALNGAMWGALAPIFAVHGVMGHAFLPFVIAGTSAGSIVSAGASWRAVLAFNIPALVPLAATYIFTAGVQGIPIATVIGLYALATTYLAINMQRMVDRSILLHTKNNNLFSALQREVDQAHEAEQRFRSLVESSNELTIIFSPEGCITYASPSAYRVLDAAPGALIGKTTKQIVHPDDIPLFRAVGEKALSKLGEGRPLQHICLKAPPSDAAYVALSGRLANMLYVPGVEGFVFTGGLLASEESRRVHAAE